jgi:hypothetical protein
MTLGNVRELGDTGEENTNAWGFPWLLRGRRHRPRRRAAKQPDELTPFQSIKLLSVPACQGRIGEYRIGEDQSAGYHGHFATDPSGQGPVGS